MAQATSVSKAPEGAYMGAAAFPTSGTDAPIVWLMQLNSVLSILVGRGIGGADGSDPSAAVLL